MCLKNFDIYLKVFNILGIREKRVILSVGRYGHELGQSILRRVVRVLQTLMMKLAFFQHPSSFH